jgi:O-antigen ligase
MNTTGSNLLMRLVIVAMSLTFVLVAVFLGLIGAVTNWYLQLLIISVAVPGVLLLVDYRIGLAFIILLLPYANSPFLPKAGPVSMVNVLILGVVFSAFIRWLMFRLGGRILEVPIPRELIWFYFVPFAIAMLIGTTHLGEIPAHIFAVKLGRGEKYGLHEYWISFYLKTMLLVAAVFALGAAVLEGKKVHRYTGLVVASGCLYSLGIFAVVFLSGYSLEQIKDIRDSLRPLGHHNNDAGYMLMWPFAAALFMREFVTGRARVVLTMATFLTFLGIILTFSRGGFLAAIAVVAYYLWHFRRLRATIFVAASAVVALMFAPDAVRDRLLTGLEDKSVYSQVASSSGSGDELTAGRVFIWRNMAPEVLNSPLFGRGVDSGMWSEFVKNGSIFSHPHNMYLSILMDLGILGAICMIFAFRYVWRLFGRLSKDNRLDRSVQGYFAGARAALIGMLAAGIAGVAYLPLNHQLYLWVSIGLAAGFSRRLEIIDQTGLEKPVVNANLHDEARRAFFVPR